MNKIPSEKVSVIIPAYNCDDTIQSALNSAESQTLSPHEIIIVDDGSEDNTYEVVTSHFEGKDKCEILHHKNNQGQNAAQNTGLKAATGKYIAFLDADDEWDTNKLEQQVRYLGNKPSNFAACYCGVLHSDPTKRRPRNHIERVLSQIYSKYFGGRVREGQEEIVKEILTNKFYLGGMSTLLVERDILQKMGGFDESVERITDLIFVLHLLDYGDLAYVDQNLVRKYGGNTTTAENLIEYKRKFLSKYSEQAVQLEFKAETVVSAHKFDIAKFHFNEGNIKDGILWLRQSTLPRNRELYSLTTSIFTGGLKIFDRFL